MDDFLVMTGTPFELQAALREHGRDYEPGMLTVVSPGEPPTLCLLLRSHASIDREQERQMRRQVSMARRANGLITQ
jgi:hypothetical protein